MRPIDADALIENLQGSKVTTDSKDLDYKTMWQLLCTLVVETIENEPTVLPSADAVQGEWIEKYNGNGWNDFWDYTCSHCGKKYERADAVLYHANYCPNCGAKMKGGAE